MTTMTTKDKARGKWRGILLALGADDKCLTGKHCPCPFCGGRDRFRFDNQGGNGSFICSQCGAGDGFEFLKRLKGLGFKDAAHEVDQIIGNVKAEPVKQQPTDAERMDRLNRLWMGAVPLCDDLATAYLRGRGVLPNSVPACLRYHASCPAPGGERYPALLAMITDTKGNPCSIHRTFLGTQGKAPIDDPRATMPGPLPDGCAVRLYPTHGERLGIAEGIETAIAAAKRFRMPVWAAINATMLSKWQPPEGVGSVVIFGDNDAGFRGQAASYALANRLSERLHLDVEVRLPSQPGTDWADADAA